MLLSSIEQLEESVLDKICLSIKPHKNLLEDFRSRFKDLLNRGIPEWIISPFDVEKESDNFDTFLNENIIEMTFDLEANWMLLGGGDCSKISQALCNC